MQYLQKVKLVALVAVALTLSACGGGGSSNATTAPPTAETEVVLTTPHNPGEKPGNPGDTPPGVEIPGNPGPSHPPQAGDGDDRQLGVVNGIETAVYTTPRSKGLHAPVITPKGGGIFINAVSWNYDDNGFLVQTLNSDVFGVNYTSKGVTIFTGACELREVQADVHRESPVTHLEYGHVTIACPAGAMFDHAVLVKLDLIPSFRERDMSFSGAIVDSGINGSACDQSGRREGSNSESMLCYHHRTDEAGYALFHVEAVTMPDENSFHKWNKYMQQAVNTFNLYGHSDSESIVYDEHENGHRKIAVDYQTDGSHKVISRRHGEHDVRVVFDLVNTDRVFGQEQEIDVIFLEARQFDVRPKGYIYEMPVVKDYMADLNIALPEECTPHAISIAGGDEKGFSHMLVEAECIPSSHAVHRYHDERMQVFAVVKSAFITPDYDWAPVEGTDYYYANFRPEQEVPCNPGVPRHPSK